MLSQHRLYPAGTYDAISRDVCITIRRYICKIMKYIYLSRFYLCYYYITTMILRYCYLLIVVPIHTTEDTPWPSGYDTGLTIVSFQFESPLDPHKWVGKMVAI